MAYEYVDEAEIWDDDRERRGISGQTQSLCGVYSYEQKKTYICHKPKPAHGNAQRAHAW